MRHGGSSSRASAPRRERRRWRAHGGLGKRDVAERAPSRRARTDCSPRGSEWPFSRCRRPPQRRRVHVVDRTRGRERNGGRGRPPRDPRARARARARPRSFRRRDRHHVRVYRGRRGVALARGRRRGRRLFSLPGYGAAIADVQRERPLPRAHDVRRRALRARTRPALDLRPVRSLRPIVVQGTRPRRALRRDTELELWRIGIPMRSALRDRHGLRRAVSLRSDDRGWRSAMRGRGGLRGGTAPLHRRRGLQGACGLSPGKLREHDGDRRRPVAARGRCRRRSKRPRGDDAGGRRLRDSARRPGRERALRSPRDGVAVTGRVRASADQAEAVCAFFGCSARFL